MASGKDQSRWMTKKIPKDKDKPRRGLPCRKVGF